MRIAAFQIDVGNGTVHLVCVPTSSFRTACDLESWLNSHVGPKCDVKFLGRFDHVQSFTAMAEVKARIAPDYAVEDSMGTVVNIETGVKKVRSSQ
jgi:hypothetical protein